MIVGLSEHLEDVKLYEPYVFFDRVVFIKEYTKDKDGMNLVLITPEEYVKLTEKNYVYYDGETIVTVEEGKIKREGISQE